MAGPIQITTKYRDSGAARGIDRVSDRGRRMGATLAKAGKAAAIGLTIVAVAAVGAAGKVASAAAQDQQSANRMAQTFTKAAGAKRSEIAATEAWITKQGKAFGVTDDQLRPALSKLVTATKDVGQAQRLASLAMDVSAGTGKSLEQVSTALMKAQNGQVSSLSRLGINTKNAAGETISMATATKRMGGLFGGAAASNADTLQGRIDRLKLMFSEAGESLGYKLLPPLLDFSDWAIAKGIPAVTRIATTLSGALAPPLRAVGGFVVDLVSRFRDFSSGVQGGTSALTPLVSAFQTYANTARTVVIPAVVSVAQYLTSRLVPVFTQVASIITGKVLPIVGALAQFFYGQLIPAVVAIASKVATNLRPVFDQLVTTFSTKVLPAVSKLLAKFEQARPTIQRVTLVVVKIIGKVLEFASAVLGKVLPVVIRFAGFLIGGFVKALIGVVTGIVKAVGKVIEFGTAMFNAGKKVAEFEVKVAKKIADVVGFFAAVPGKIKKVFTDPLGLLKTIGGQIVDGLKSGIENAWHKVTDVVDNLIQKIPKKIREIMGIASPSKVARALGRFISQGLALGIADGTAGVSKVLARVTGLIEKTFAKRYKDDKVRAARTKATLKGLREEFAALTSNAKAQDRINKALSTARDRLNAARQAFAEYAAAVKAGIVESGNITNLGQNEDGSVSSTGLVDQLKDKLIRAQRFAALIAQLTRDKLNATSLQQIISAGVDGGLATAEALTAGGSSTIAQVNDLAAQLAAQGQALGQATAQTFHGAGVSAAEALVQGLEARANKLDKFAQRLAQRLLKALRKALGGQGGGQGGDDPDDKPRKPRQTRRGPAPRPPAPRRPPTPKPPPSGVPEVIEIRLSADALDQLSAGKRYIAAIDTAIDKGARTRHLAVTRSNA